MKLNARQIPALPTATKSIASTSQTESAPTQASKSLKQRSPEPVHFGAGDFHIITRDDGAVLATASGSNGEGYPVSKAVTLVPPSTQTLGVKTITMTADKEYGSPVFKITPFTFETMDGEQMAFANESFPAAKVPSANMLPVVAALRLQNEFVPGDAYGGPGSNAKQTYTIRAIDSVITLDSGWQRFNTLNPSPTAAAIGGSIAPAIISSVAPSAADAAITGGRTGLSKGELAGIGGGAAGLALLVGVGATLLYRRSQVAKRAAKSEEFGMKVLPIIDPAAFAKV